MLDEPEDPSRPNNLFHPVDIDPGAHGPFDHRAIDDRPLPSPVAHPLRYAAVAGAAVAFAALLVRRSSRG